MSERRKRRGEKTAEEYVKDGKVIIAFAAVGDAPILKQAKFKLHANARFQHIFNFLRNQVGLETIFCFVDQQFQPNPDELVMDLFRCFHEKGTLHIHYATTLAWG